MVIGFQYFKNISTERFAKRHFSTRAGTLHSFVDGSMFPARASVAGYESAFVNRIGFINLNFSPVDDQTAMSDDHGVC